MAILSILIPARNEEFLGVTIKNILENIEGDTEVITVLDGYTDPIPELPIDQRVKVITLEKSIGQRAATNLACKSSEAKYVMKVDAHCSFDKGFDVKMMSKMEDNWTMIPTMRNLHAFDWVCEDGHRRYQGTPGACPVCGKSEHKEIVWVGKTNPQSNAYRFDKNMHFQYWGEFAAQQSGDITETMSIQGSCFMLTRDKYWELNICDENFGSWGQQGVEVACKTWLSGGRVVVNRTTWYAHLFRTQPGFGFPYPNGGIAQQRARDFSKDLFLKDKFDKAIYPFQWLINKFNPPGWEPVTKGIIYYTDNQLDAKIMDVCQKQLIKVESSTLPIVSVSLKPIEFGVNYVLPLERGILTMHKQILHALKKSTADVVFFCEHDVIYHPSHFEFIPPKKDVYYYNNNLWRVRLKDGFAVKYDHKSLSQICAYRETLIKEYEERIRRIEAEGFNKGGYEPGTRSLRLGGFSDSKSEYFNSTEPNIDIRHATNQTASKWRPEDFRSYRSCRNWQNGHADNLWAKEQLKLLIK